MLVSAVVASAATAATQTQANPISFDFWTFFFQAVNVLVVLGVLTKLLFKPLGEMMAKREKRIADSLAEAAAARSEADRLLAEYTQKIQSTQSEVTAIMSKAARASDDYQKQRMQEADAAYERMISRAKEEIATEQSKAVVAVRQEIAGMVILATSKVIGKSLQEADQHRLVDEIVAKVGEKN
ncbi:MAG: F0F1 ATP synthase subunit B [Kiritimatiellia bacterium]